MRLGWFFCWESFLTSIQISLKNVMHNYYCNLMDRSQPIPLCFLGGISTRNRNGVFISAYLSWMEAPAGALGSESRVEISVNPGSPYQASVLYHTVETERICVILSFFQTLTFWNQREKIVSGEIDKEQSITQCLNTATLVILFL